jgi:hypothetical protein
MSEQKWQAIETVPEDGRPFIAFAEAFRPEYEGQLPYLVSSNGDWFRRRGREHGWTHWLPLPAPPIVQLWAKFRAGSPESSSADDGKGAR